MIMILLSTFNSKDPKS